MREGSKKFTNSILRKYMVAASLLLTFGISAQPYTGYDYSIKIDSSVYKVGASIPLWQEWIFPENDDVLNPSVPDSFGPLLRVDVGEIEFKNDDGFTKATRISEFTVLDTGDYIVSPQQWYFKDSQYVESSPFNLRVIVVEADTALPTKPIFDVKSVPYTTSEILTWVAIGIGILALVLLLLWAIFVYLPSLKKQPEVIQKRVVPPYQTALKELSLLEEQALWQSGKVKKYHSGISTIIRVYIQNHFALNVVDLPTDDVLDRVQLLKLDRELLVNLNNVLQMGDLAKFAKGIPSAQDNEYCMQTAIKFVKATKNHFEPKTEALD